MLRLKTRRNEHVPAGINASSLNIELLHKIFSDAAHSKYDENVAG